LALILGDVTEDLALRSGDVIGGLVNATFGNVVELILSCVALTKKTKELNDVAGLSNLGSVLSNLLLVLGVSFLHSLAHTPDAMRFLQCRSFTCLHKVWNHFCSGVGDNVKSAHLRAGCCFFFGGLKHKVQIFNSVANQVSNSLLFLAVVGLILPWNCGQVGHLMRNCKKPLQQDAAQSGEQAAGKPPVVLIHSGQSVPDIVANNDFIFDSGATHHVVNDPCLLYNVKAPYFAAQFSSDDILAFSRVIAILLLVAYLAYLYFQLVSHNDLFTPEIEEASEAGETEEPALTVTAELGILFAISVVVALASECAPSHDCMQSICDILKVT
jgi:Ca2+/H+ antiporter